MEETKRRRFIIRAVLEGEVDVQGTGAFIAGPEI